MSEWPDGNNVYGILNVTIRNLSRVRKACAEFGDEVYIKKNKDGSRLFFRGKTAEFDTVTSTEAEQLLAGMVIGSESEIKKFVEKLSDSIIREDVSHIFEIYDKKGNLYHRIAR